MTYLRADYNVDRADSLLHNTMMDSNPLGELSVIRIVQVSTLYNAFKSKYTPEYTLSSSDQVCA